MARKEVTDDFDLFGDTPAPSRRRRVAAQDSTAGGPSGPAMAGGPSGPAMAGGPSGPAMAGGPSGPAMSGALSGSSKCKKAPARRKRSMDDETFKSLF